MYKINRGLKEWHLDSNSFLDELIAKSQTFNFKLNNPIRNIIQIYGEVQN